MIGLLVEWQSREERFLRVAIACTLIGLALLSNVHCASSRAVRAGQAAFVVTQVADLHSTHAALVSGRGVEANPLMPDAWWQQAAIKALPTAGVVWLGSRLERTGHRTAAVVFEAALATAVAIVAGHNYSIAVGGRR